MKPEIQEQIQGQYGDKVVVQTDLMRETLEGFKKMGFSFFLIRGVVKQLYESELFDKLILVADDESIVYPNTNGRFDLDDINASIKDRKGFSKIRQIRVYDYNYKEVGSSFRLY